MGDDFALMPHASPQTEYPKRLLKLGVESFLLAEADHWILETVDYGAHPYQGTGELRIEHAGSILDGVWSVNGRELQVTIGDRRCAIPLAKSDDPATQARHAMIEIAKTS